MSVEKAHEHAASPLQWADLYISNRACGREPVQFASGATFMKLDGCSLHLGGATLPHDQSIALAASRHNMVLSLQVRQKSDGAL